MPTRTFTDSAGTSWEVFEVRRSSQKAQAVSAGLELGWLSFVSAGEKRRLAPIPSHWNELGDVELERLCHSARVARPAAFAMSGASAAAPPDGPERPRTRVPRIRPARTSQATVAIGDLPILSTASSAAPVEQTVREFAHQARERNLPAIEAMVELKALLGRVYTDPSSPARDVRAVRRWFVDAYYFEHDAKASAATDQSR